MRQRRALSYRRWGPDRERLGREIIVQAVNSTSATV
jgi:hypothetical protein